MHGVFLNTTELNHFINCSVFPHLTEHRQLFGEVHHSGDGRGDDFCKLTEGFDVHLAALRRADDRPLTYVISLK